MEQEIHKLIFNAIKLDDVKSFSLLVSQNSCLNLCYGRFPLLSLCYMYDSTEILLEFEDKLCKINNYTFVDEYFEMYERLKLSAKKSLRLYLDKKIISPLEMLAILDRRQKIAKDYEKFYKNSEITQNVEKIYKLTNKIKVTADLNSFYSPKKNFDQKSKRIISIISVVLCFMMLFPIFSILITSKTSGLGTSSSPIYIKNERELKTALSKSSRYYVLSDDIILTDDLSINNFSGTLDGNGKTIYAGSKLSGSIVKNLTGKIKNLTLQIEYSNLKISSNLAFLAQNSTGIIENCEISGSITAVFENEDDAYLSLFVNQNSGTIKDSIASVQVSVSNSTEKNSFLTAFSSQNTGTITGCKSANLSFVSDTVDTACFAINNNGTIDSCENNLTISQTSALLWHPNTAGFVVSNSGVISNSINNSDIMSVTTNQTESTEQNSTFVIYSSGIAVENYGKIDNVTNNGKITSNSIIANTYASGVACINNNTILNSTNNGEIIGGSQKSFVVTGGIAGRNNLIYSLKDGMISFLVSSISSCKNTGEIKSDITENFDLNTNSYVAIYSGGIAGVSVSLIQNSENTGNITSNSKSTNIYSGGVLGLSGFVLSSDLDRVVSVLISQGYLKFAITGCTSKSKISSKSETASSFIGGICGYASLNVNTSAVINDSSFVGEIEANSYDNYVGGVIGRGDMSYIANSYAGATLINKNENSHLNYFGTLAGCYFTYGTINMSGNKVVKNDNIPALWRKVGESNISEIKADGEKIIQYDSLEDLLNSISKEA